MRFRASLIRLAALMKGWKDEITTATAIIGVVVGIIGFTLTIIQLYRTQNALRAANTYQIQKDARDILENDLLKDASFRDALNGSVKPGQQQEFDDKFWLLMNFYLSIYRQTQAGGVSPEFSTSMERDFCNFVKREAVATEWKRLAGDGRLAPEHKEMRKEWCGA